MSVDCVILAGNFSYAEIDRCVSPSSPLGRLNVRPIANLQRLIDWMLRRSFPKTNIGGLKQHFGRPENCYAYKTDP
ncbi:uncharacterized protein (DUF3820 family) [Sulfitobacter undariae]|uniref:Uncharacterized protein (DUF3820 family) n=1 Tax=Sulfitobacter undariae TaxID=1563671 RepID=A0A7W6E759_9RHOB|nr:uncharacterized protein (DUF3820 family) [Sulfitobacter undariae]